MADKIAVLIPCYNESKTVAKVIRDMKKALPEAVIYVYDNNSTDGTDEIARKEGAVVRYEYQQGKGNVIRSMFRDIDAQCYLMVDGDDTYPAEFAAEMCSKVLEKGTDMVVGDRLSGYASDIHTGALSHGLEALQDRDTARIISVFFCHSTDSFLFYIRTFVCIILKIYVLVKST